MNTESHPLASAYRVGRLLNQLTFHSQQAWFCHLSHFRMAEAAASRLAIKARELVPAASRDAFQRDLSRKMDPWLAEMIRQDRCEELIEYEERLRFIYDPAHLIPLRAGYLEPIFAALQELRGMLTSRLGDDARPALRLGEVVDQGLHPNDVYRFMEGSTSQLDLDFTLHGTPVESGETIPDRIWVDEVRQLFGELGMPGNVLDGISQRLVSIDGGSVLEIIEELDRNVQGALTFARVDLVPPHALESLAGVVEPEAVLHPSNPTSGERAEDCAVQAPPAGAVGVSVRDESAADATVVRKRLDFDRSNHSVVIDGVPIPFDNPLAFQRFEAIVAASAGGRWIRGKDLPGDGRVDRHLKKHVPADLYKLLRSRDGPGGGYRLDLPPKSP